MDATAVAPDFALAAADHSAPSISLADWDRGAVHGEVIAQLDRLIADVESEILSGRAETDAELIV